MTANNSSPADGKIPRSKRSHPLLAAPLQPGVFRICPTCRRWFALRLVEARADARQGRILVYRCVKCDAAIQFAKRHPPGAI